MSHSYKKDNPTDLNSPIFIISSERSGSNLLRRRLTEIQSEVFGPQPLHILKILYYAQPFYGDLKIKNNFFNFLKDCLGLAYNHFSPWTKKISVQEIIEWHENEWSSSNYSVVSVMHAMNTIYARKNGYKTYICKDNNIFNFCYPIVSEIPTSKFIYLYRDPRDVVTSQLSRPTQSRSVVKLATLWRDEQIKSIQAISSPILNNSQIVKVSYEDLVSDEQKVLKEICLKFDLQYDIQIKKNDIYSSEQADIHEWKNLNKPTNTSSVGRYKRMLSKRKIKLVENIAWHQMNYLEYKPDNVQRPSVRPTSLYADRVLMTFWGLICRKWNKSKLTQGQKIRQNYIKRLQTRNYL